MSMITDILTLIQRYMKSKYNYDMPEEDIRSMPYGEVVYDYWIAKAYFKEDGHYESLDDVPNDAERATIVTADVNRYYLRVNGRWEHQRGRDITRKEMNVIYGRSWP